MSSDSRHSEKITLKVCHFKVQPRNIKIAILSKRKLWLHYSFGSATLKYSLGTLKLLFYQRENSGYTTILALTFDLLEASAITSLKSLPCSLVT